MAYDKQKIFKEAKEAVENKKLFFIEDIVAYVSCGRSAFWSFFPEQSDEMDVLKDMLNKNKIEVKASLRSKWYKSNNPLTQMALYKLIGTEEEYHRIASTKTQSSQNIKVESLPDWLTSNIS